MRAKTVARVAKLTHKFGRGCRECKDWPRVWMMFEVDPEPPAACAGCGRPWTGLVRLYILHVDRADV